MPLKCPIKRAEYQKQYRLDNKERAEYMQQYYQDNKERIRIQQNYYDPVFKARKSEYNKQWELDNKKHRKEYRKQWGLDNTIQLALYKIKRRYGLTKENYIKLYEKQGGLCLGCDIKLITRLLPEKMKQYEDDPNLIYHVDYDIAWIDHDHSFDIDGKFSGDPDSVRGLLCPSCNSKDVLNLESEWYVYGDDPTVKETLIKNREANIILKQWHKEENS